jgi:hypothetical protein
MLSDIAIYLQESTFSTLGTVGFKVRQFHGNFATEPHNESLSMRRLS